MDYSLQDTPVFIINLPQSTDRKVFMRAQCENVGISPIFIDAVYGKDLSKSDIEKNCDQITAKKLFGRELLLGEIGCALSHKKIYQKIVDENIPHAVILEDDAVVESDLKRVVSLVIEKDINYDVVLLGHNRGFKNEEVIDSVDSLWGRYSLNKNYRLGMLVKGGLGTYGYMISQKGAKQILEFLEYNDLYLPIDKITSNTDIVKVYGLLPVVITVANQFNSLIENTSFRGKDREGELVYKIGKLIKKTPFFNITRALWFQYLRIKPIKK